MKLCWLLPNDKSGGISPVVLSCCRQAAQAGHKTTMLFLNKPSWLTSNQFQVSSLGLPNGAKETPKILLTLVTININNMAESPRVYQVNRLYMY